MKTIKIQDYEPKELAKMSIEELRKAQHKNEMAQRELEAHRKPIVAEITKKERQPQKGETNG